MPRLARNVFANIPHHITQRGNRREDVFFTKEDRQVYLKWLASYCQKWQVDILAYCLMSNHIHLVLTPKQTDGLQRVLKPLHMRYAQRINRANDWKGHLWQGRFFSAPLDDAYTWAAIRYVERNPVRAGIVKQAEDYLWSSAAAHCGIKSTTSLPLKTGNTVAKGDWSSWLAIEENEEALTLLRRNVEKGLPCGSEIFIEKLEKKSNKSLQYRSQGRPATNKG